MKFFWSYLIANAHPSKFSTVASNLILISLSINPNIAVAGTESSIVSCITDGRTKDIEIPRDLSTLTFLGSGGSGKVYGALSEADSNGLIIKVSNAKSSSSVKTECSILNFLWDKVEQNGYFPTKPLNIEHCLGSCNEADITKSFVFYDMFPSERRQVIFKKPFFQPSLDQPGSELVSSIDMVAAISPAKARVAVEKLAYTVLSMIVLGVASSDLQPLIDPLTGKLISFIIDEHYEFVHSGECLLIDLSEARLLDLEKPSDLDVQLTRSFLSELVAFCSSDLLRFNTFCMQTSPDNNSSSPILQFW